MALVHLFVPIFEILGLILLTILPAALLFPDLKQDDLSRFTLLAILGFLILYIIQFGAYLISAPQWTILLVYALLCVFGLLRNGVAALRRSIGWTPLLLWFGLTCWIEALQARIVTYGTVSWFGDWYEHYERTLFFFEQWTYDSRFLTGFWSLPARAPLFNANIALLMNFFGKDFWTFQTLATALNAFLVLPLALLIRDLSKVSQKTAMVCSFLICALAPVAVIQETFTWTKFFSIALSLAGIHFYVEGIRSSRKDQIFWSFVSFAAGMLAHYLVLVFAVFFAAHLLFLMARKRWPLTHGLVTLLVSSVLVLTWIVYVVTMFGVKETVTANSSFGKWASAKVGYQAPPPWSEVFVENIVSTFVPYSWRHGIQGIYRTPYVRQVQPLPARVLIPTRYPCKSVDNDPRVQRFSDVTANADSLTANIGLSGFLALAAALLWKKKDENSIFVPPGGFFWLLFFVLGVPINIFFSRVYAPEGVAHLNLQPYVCLLAVFIIAGVRNAPRSVKLALAGVFLVESIYSCYAILALQYMSVGVSLAGDQLVVPGKVGLNQLYIANYIYKLQVQAEFLSDHFGNLAGAFGVMCATIALTCLILLSRKSS